MNGHSLQLATPIRVALMCENQLVCQTLGPRLGADRSLGVVGLYDCTIERVPEVLSQGPQVVILAVSRITHFNMLVCQALRQSQAGLRLVILPSYLDTPEDVQHALAGGADVVVEKSIDTPALVDRIHTLMSQVA